MYLQSILAHTMLIAKGMQSKALENIVDKGDDVRRLLENRKPHFVNHLED